MSAGNLLRRALRVDRTEVTDRMLIFGERHLRSVLAAYAVHYTTRSGRTARCSCVHLARKATVNLPLWVVVYLLDQE
jgi:hypothetical protein